MVKNKILTPVLAGVLGLTVAGSGVGYYFTKDDNSNGIKNGNKLSQVADNLNSTIGRAEKALSGELDFAYSANATVTFGEGFTSISGVELKPIEVIANTKQKGGNTGVDFNFKYDGKNLVSLNSAIDRENKNAYVQIPELSDGYLKANGDSIKELLDSQLSSSGSSVNFDKIFDGSDVDFDTEALQKDIESYGDLIKENIPEGKESSDKISGDINGNKYEYTVKVYTVTGEDVKKIVTSILEKAKNDETLKNTLTQSNAEITAETYDELISEYLRKVDESFADDGMSKSVDFDVYYDNDAFAGFNFSEDDVSAKMITIDESDVSAIDFTFNAGEKSNAVFKGSAETKNDIVNGNFDFDMNAEDTSLNASFKIENVKSSEDVFSGKVRADFNVSGSSSDPFSGWCEMNSDSNSDKTEFTYDIGLNGKSFVTVKFAGNKTEASDITIPNSDKVYDVTDENALNTYLTDCDTNGFMSNIKNALGDDLYNKLFSSGSGLNDPYYYDTDLYDYSSEDLTI